MQTTNEFLDSVKAKHGLTSDYQLSKLMQCTHSVISGYRHGRSKMDEETACKVADLLELEPGYVMACIAAERAKSEKVKKAWQHIANMAVAATVLLVIGGVSIGGLPIGAQGPALLTETTGAGTVYIMSNAVLEYWPIILPLFALWLWVFLRHTPHPDKNPDHRTH